MTGPERGGVGVAGRFGVGGELLAWRRCCLRKCNADIPDRVRIYLILEALVRHGGRLARLGLARRRWLRA